MVGTDPERGGRAFVLTLGVRDGARSEFWRYLRRAATSHRRYFAHAMTLAAMGYHFRKLTESFGE